MPGCDIELEVEDPRNMAQSDIEIMTNCEINWNDKPIPSWMERLWKSEKSFEYKIFTEYVIEKGRIPPWLEALHTSNAGVPAHLGISTLQPHINSFKALKTRIML